jgi:hypothetical protein
MGEGAAIGEVAVDIVLGEVDGTVRKRGAIRKPASVAAARPP